MSRCRVFSFFLRDLILPTDAVLCPGIMLLMQCNELHSTAMHCIALPSNAIHCNAMCCKVLQNTAQTHTNIAVTKLVKNVFRLHNTHHTNLSAHTHTHNHWRNEISEQILRDCTPLFDCTTPKFQKNTKFQKIEIAKKMINKYIRFWTK